MSERLRELERAVLEAPDDLVALRALADERRRRGDEFLPDVLEPVLPWPLKWVLRFLSLQRSLRKDPVARSFGFETHEADLVAADWLGHPSDSTIQDWFARTAGLYLPSHPVPGRSFEWTEQRAPWVDP